MRNIIITGASGNLGTALLAALADTNYRLHIPLRSPEPAPDSPQIVHHLVELSGDADCRALVATIEATHGPVYAGIFLAGAYSTGTLADTTWAEVQRMFAINVGTVVPLFTALTKHFEATSTGKLITIGARASQADAAQNHVAYALSKDVLWHLTNIAQAGFTHNTSAHILMPNALDTPTNRAAMPDAPDSSFTKLEDLVALMIGILEGATTEAFIAC